MEPTIHQGERVLVAKRWLLPITAGSIVILHHPQSSKVLLKRVKEIKGKMVFVVGDNMNESTDSRDFGWIEKKNIMGKITHI